jgi:hypothetical protein
LTYAAAGLPPGLSIGPTSGVISGTVDYHAAELLGGAYTVTVVAADGEGGGAQVTFGWTVDDSNRPPVLAVLPAQSNAEGDAVSLTVRVYPESFTRIAGRFGHS